MGYFVQQHEREIGIRVALGGTRRDVLQLVVTQGMRVVVAGVVVGVVAAFGVTRFIASLLYGVDPRSLAMFSGVTVLLTGIALLACLLPARRAVRLEPATVLRNE
jgi:ABC-type lipoprotein release transport system permease subunit